MHNVVLAIHQPYTCYFLSLSTCFSLSLFFSLTLPSFLLSFLLFIFSLPSSLLSSLPSVGINYSFSHQYFLSLLSLPIILSLISLIHFCLLLASLLLPFFITLHIHYISIVSFLPLSFYHPSFPPSLFLHITFPTSLIHLSLFPFPSLPPSLPPSLLLYLPPLFHYRLFIFLIIHQQFHY